MDWLVCYKKKKDFHGQLFVVYLGYFNAFYDMLLRKIESTLSLKGYFELHGIKL